MSNLSEISNLILVAALTLGSAGVILTTYRLVKGPDVGSRAVALDVLTLITMPMMIGLALYTGRAIYLDVTLVYGVLAFLGVTALARYVDRGI